MSPGKPGWLVQIGTGTGAYRTMGDHTRFVTAVRHYDGFNVHSGGKKRLLRVRKDGSMAVVHRVITTQQTERVTDRFELQSTP